VCVCRACRVSCGRCEVVESSNTQLVASVGFQYTQLDSPYSSGSGSLKLNFQGTSIALLLQLG
jgi:hypothetical protein